MATIEMDQVYAPIAPPSGTPYRFGLLSVVTPEPDTSEWEGFGITWISAPCATPRTTDDPCIVDNPPALTADTVCGQPMFQPFTAYQLVKGSPRNRDRDAQVAQDRLALVEQYAVEGRLWTLLTAAVTEVAVTGAARGLALVEQMLVEDYPAQGVIHMNRLMGILLADQLIRDGARLVTTLGTPVAVGGGYGPVAGANPSTAAIYGTGPIVLRRAPIQPIIQVPTNETNTAASLAQRTFAVGWDCSAVGVTVTL